MHLWKKVARKRAAVLHMICPQVNSRKDGRQLRWLWMSVWMSDRTTVQGTVMVQCRAAWCRVDYLGVRWNDGEVQHTHAKSKEVTECLVVMWKLRYPEKSKVWHDFGYQWQQWNALAQLWTFCTTILVKNCHIYTNLRTFLSSKTILYSEDRRL